jgi:hypothetical protein
MNLGDNAGEMGNSLTAISLGVGKIPSLVQSGNSHTCVSFESGDVKCFGYNLYGQLGLVCDCVLMVVQ